MEVLVINVKYLIWKMEHATKPSGANEHQILDPFKRA